MPPKKRSNSLEDKKSLIVDFIKSKLGVSQQGDMGDLTQWKVKTRDDEDRPMTFYIMLDKGAIFRQKSGKTRPRVRPGDVTLDMHNKRGFIVSVSERKMINDPGVVGISAYINADDIKNNIHIEGVEPQGDKRWTDEQFKQVQSLIERVGRDAIINYKKEHGEAPEAGIESDEPQEDQPADQPEKANSPEFGSPMESETEYDPKERVPKDSPFYMPPGPPLEPGIPGDVPEWTPPEPEKPEYRATSMEDAATEIDDMLKATGKKEVTKKIDDKHAVKVRFSSDTGVPLITASILDLTDRLNPKDIGDYQILYDMHRMQQEGFKSGDMDKIANMIASKAIRDNIVKKLGEFTGPSALHKKLKSMSMDQLESIAERAKSYKKK